MAMRKGDMPPRATLWQSAERVHIAIMRMGLAPDIKVKGLKADQLIMVNTDDMKIGHIAQCAFMPERIFDHRIMIAGQQHDGNFNSTNEISDALDQRLRRLMRVKCIAHQQYHIGFHLARFIKHDAQRPCAIATMGARGITMVHMNVRCVDNHKLTRQTLPLALSGQCLAHLVDQWLRQGIGLAHQSFHIDA